MTSGNDINERGSVLVVAMVSLVGLLAVGGIAIVASQQTIGVSAHERFEATALLAAEGGVHATMDYLSQNIDPALKWSALVFPSNIDIATGRTVPPEPNIPGNTLDAGVANSLFTADSRMSFSATILNNFDDPDFDVGGDADGIILIRSVGRGPNNTTVILEVEVGGGPITTTGNRPCPNYSQRGIAADGSGRNDCLSTVDGTVTGSYRPGS